MELTKQLGEVRNASSKLISLSNEEINNILLALAQRTEQLADNIIAMNAKDLEAMDKNDPRYDRLLLNPARIKSIADDIRHVASLDNPVGKTQSESLRPNGLLIKKITVPMGVIGVIYESRPNVTFDVFSLCFKTGNACVLRGGKESHNSNACIVQIIQDVLKEHGIDPNVIALLAPSRDATAELLTARGLVDVIIPRGSQGLIDFVRENAKIPVIETGAGVVHVFFDKDGDVEKGKAIIYNSKTRRVSVCNALDCLLIHRSRLRDLPELVSGMELKNVEIFADDESYAVLEGKYPKELLYHATADSFGTEFLAYRMSIKTVASIDEAITHIAEHSSSHSESIVSENKENCEKFLHDVDAAVVYANASTAFTDGGQFGLGAEIGISTQKLHARGPMGLDALTSYKWVVFGSGQIRE